MANYTVVVVREGGPIGGTSVAHLPASGQQGGPSSGGSGEEPVLTLPLTSRSRNFSLTCAAVASEIDFKKIFDDVDQTFTLPQLYLQRRHPSLVSFIQNFVSDRRPRVKYQNVLLDRHHITCGVPQGARLGPLIILAVINGPCRNVPASAVINDATVASGTRAVPNFNINLQQVIDEIRVEARQANEFPMPQKCEVAFISRQKRLVIFPLCTQYYCTSYRVTRDVRYIIPSQNRTRVVDHMSTRAAPAVFTSFRVRACVQKKDIDHIVHVIYQDTAGIFRSRMALRAAEDEVERLEKIHCL